MLEIFQFIVTLTFQKLKISLKILLHFELPKKLIIFTIYNSECDHFYALGVTFRLM